MPGSKLYTPWQRVINAQLVLNSDLLLVTFTFLLTSPLEISRWLLDRMMSKSQSCCGQGSKEIPNVSTVNQIPDGES
jgi:hypothetical protein